MAGHATSLVERRHQLRVFLLVSLVVSGLTGLLVLVGSGAFRRLFGSGAVSIGVPLVALLGLALWWAILPRDRFVVYDPGATRLALPTLFVLPSLLALGTILVDLFVGFPPDLNVTGPDALLFYPVIGFVVEVLFHLLPVATVLLVADALGRDVGRSRGLLFVFVGVALLEPAFQLQLGFTATLPSWATVAIAAIIFAFNLAQLYIFWRYDFLTTYAFRLVYYLVWHVVWGHLRLQVLF